jgi:iron complex outermembrane recepter protein
MSELMSIQNTERGFRRHLLTTVSALALLAAVYGTNESKAEDQDVDRPTVWIELGGQLEQMNDGQEPLAPHFVANLPDTFFSPLDVEKPLRFSYGGEGAISFEPEGSDWVFSASVRYGRSNGVREKHQQTPNAKVPIAPFTFFGNHLGGYSFYPSHYVKLEYAKVQQSETHAVVDFQAGKDVGLGMFGRSGSSVLSIGVRIAQFTSKANINLRAVPDVHYPSAALGSFYAKYIWKHTPIHFHDYAAMLAEQRSFRGLGPSIAWNSSAPFVGNSERGEITLDWGANAAILFGRQRARGHHQTSANSFYGKSFSTAIQGDTPSLRPGGFFGTGSKGGYHGQNLYNRAVDFNRMRTVIVPNVGGFAGISFLYANAKVNLGYRGDFFFGALDGGIDAAKKETRGFYGPFATISVGFP